MKKGQWALAQEIVRHVEPFLGLDIDDLRLLEAFHNVSTRGHSLFGSIKGIRPVASYDVAANSLQNLLDLRILLADTNPGAHIVNLYGLIKLYLPLVGENSKRKTTPTRLARVETLLRDTAKDFELNKLPLLDLAIFAPELGPRQPVQVGRAEPVMDTLLKSRLIEASMSVAVGHFKIMSEFTVFMRVVNMTLERNLITRPKFSIDRVLYGYGPRGSLGLPLTEKSIRSALKSLQNQGIILIQRPYARSKIGRLSINVPGIAAVNARDHRSIRAYELFLTSWDLVRSLDVNLALRSDPILDTKISDIAANLSYNHGDIHREIHTSLGGPVNKVRVKGHWSDGSCPTAAETHVDGSDDDPSFGIMINEDGGILYNCWACQDGQVRPISHLFSKLAEYSQFPHEAHRICVSASKLLRTGAISIPEFEGPEALSDEVLEKYPLLTRYAKQGTGYLKKYLQDRGVTPDAYERFRVRYLPAEGLDSKSPRTLVTEFTNFDGAVVALRLRVLTGKGRRFTTIGSFGSAMFGLAQVSRMKPLLVVEGEIDAQCAYSYGFHNVVAVGGATRKTSLVADVISRWGGQKIYLGLDGDETGQEAQERLIEALESEIPHRYALDWSQIRLPEPVIRIAALDILVRCRRHCPG